jgi:hypothetical protein
MRWSSLVLALALVASVPAPPATGQGQDAAPAAQELPPPRTPGGSAETPESPAAESAAGGVAISVAASDGAQWVATHSSTDLWSDSEGGVSFGKARQWTYLELTGQAADGRVYVLNPRSGNYAWVDVEAVGPVPAPPDSYFSGPQVLYAVEKPGRIIGGFNLRSWPDVRDDTMVRPLGHNAPVFVQEAVLGDDGETWYRVGDEEYVHASGVRLPKAPPQTFSGRWIDVDLSEPAMISAYEGDRIVATALTIKGTQVDPTPVGVHRIQRRVASEIMDSATVGIPRNSPRGYYLRNVLYTQYFTGGGASIHYNYWSSVFGYAGSHGCLGLSYDDALWYWNWATVGTPLNIHY